MHIFDIFEGTAPKVVVTYPGRFQPFHKGHRDVFLSLQKKFGSDNVFIVSSDKVDPPRSPFSFSDKVQFMRAAGIPAHSIIQASQVYDLPAQFQGEKQNIVFITALGAPEAQRLGTGKQKKDGSPAYFQPMPGDSRKLQTADKHGYVVIEPEHPETITVGGDTIDVSHGTQTRALWSKISGNPQLRKEFIAQMYGKYHAELEPILDKIASVAEDKGYGTTFVGKWKGTDGPEKRYTKLVGEDGQEIAENNAGEYDDLYSPEAIELGTQFIKEFNLTDSMDQQLAIEIVDNVLGTGETNISKIKKQVIKYLKMGGAVIKEGTADRRINRMWEIITDYEKRAKATKNDIKRNHYLAMAEKMRSDLDSMINDANEMERGGNMIAQHDAEPSATWNRGGLAEGQNNNGVEVSNIEPGDTITWWYNRAHPNYEGIVREVRGSTLIVYAPGSGDMYQLTKDDIRSHEKKQGVAEGLPQTLRKVVPGYAKREIDKKMDAGKFGKTDADKDANFQRYKKIQDKLKEQGVAEGSIDQIIADKKKNNPLQASVKQSKFGYSALVTYKDGKPAWYGGAYWQTPELAMGHAKAFVNGYPHLEQEYAQRFIDKNRDGIAQQGVAEGQISTIAIEYKIKADDGKYHQRHVVCDKKDLEAKLNQLRNKSNIKDIKVVEQGVAEGEVVAFPKKHRGDLEDIHDCPKCGGDLQGGTYMGHKVKVCIPCKQVYLPPNSGIDKNGNKIEEDAAGVGVVKNGKDPRYMMATMGDQNDVDASTLGKMMKGYSLVGKNPANTKQRAVTGSVGKGIKESRDVEEATLGTKYKRNRFRSIKKDLDEVSLGDYYSKAQKSKISNIAKTMFADPAKPEVQTAMRNLKNREAGIKRAGDRGRKALAAQQEKSRADSLANDTANIEQLKAQLAQLRAEFDPDYEFSDDHSEWTHQRGIAQQINALQRRINDVSIGLDEDDEVHEHAPSGDPSPVESAICRRIMTQHRDALMKYGPDKVMAACHNKANDIGPVDEIGSSDVSGWCREVLHDLENEMFEGLYSYDKLDPYNSEFAPAAGMGRMTLRGWKQTLTKRVEQLARELEAAGKDVDRGALWDHVYKKLKSMNLDPIAQEIEQGQDELEQIRRKGGPRSRAFGTR